MQLMTSVPAPFRSRCIRERGVGVAEIEEGSETNDDVEMPVGKRTGQEVALDGSHLHITLQRRRSEVPVQRQYGRGTARKQQTVAGTDAAADVEHRFPVDKPAGEAIVLFRAPARDAPNDGMVRCCPIDYDGAREAFAESELIIKDDFPVCARERYREPRPVRNEDPAAKDVEDYTLIGSLVGRRITGLPVGNPVVVVPQYRDDLIRDSPRLGGQLVH